MNIKLFHDCLAKIEFLNDEWKIPFVKSVQFLDEDEQEKCMVFLQNIQKKYTEQNIDIKTAQKNYIEMVETFLEKEMPVLMRQFEEEEHREEGECAENLIKGL